MVKPRPPQPTVKCVDTYCQLYQDLFPEVRAYEAFKYLHVGLISNIKRKSLPEIAKAVGLKNEQGLLHFLTQSPWRAEELEKRRLEIILNILERREIIVIIDETGDKKKGKKTDYVKRQYIGNLGKIESGIVSVNAYGYCEGMTFPLKFKVFKPKERLKEGDKYQTKPELGGELVREICQMGFKIKRVLADSFYGESHSNFISIILGLGREYAVAIRSNHGVWLPSSTKVRANKWRAFKHKRWDGIEENRYIREIIYGRRREIRYWDITTDKENPTSANTWFVMTSIPDIKYQEVGAIYGIRTWIEYGFKQCKSELGWADFRITNYSQVQKWWELVLSAYLMVCLHNEDFNSSVNPVPNSFSEHQEWNERKGWKNWLNNLQLILQPFVSFNHLLKWLKVFPIPQLSLGFPRLIAQMNEFDCLQYLVYCWDDFCYSSA
jgi:SRSO17 transposase